MHPITSLITIFIVSLVFITQRSNVFGASFYEDMFDFERRDAVISSVLSGENLIMNVATEDQVARLKKLLPNCLTLSNADLQKLLEAFFNSHPDSIVRRKRYADYMKRFENNMDDEYHGYFNVERRVTNAEKTVIADNLNKFLAKLSQNNLSTLNQRIQLVNKGGVSEETRFLEAMIEVSDQCSTAKKARRLLQLRPFLENELMNDNN